MKCSIVRVLRTLPALALLLVGCGQSSPVSLPSGTELNGAVVATSESAQPLAPLDDGTLFLSKSLLVVAGTVKGMESVGDSPWHGVVLSDIRLVARTWPRDVDPEGNFANMAALADHGEERLADGQGVDTVVLQPDAAFDVGTPVLLFLSWGGVPDNDGGVQDRFGVKYAHDLASDQPVPGFEGKGAERVLERLRVAQDKGVVGAEATDMSARFPDGVAVADSASETTGLLVAWAQQRNVESLGRGVSPLIKDVLGIEEEVSVPGQDGPAAGALPAEVEDMTDEQRAGIGSEWVRMLLEVDLAVPVTDETSISAQVRGAGQFPLSILVPGQDATVLDAWVPSEGEIQFLVQQGDELAPLRFASSDGSEPSDWLAYSVADDGEFIGLFDVDLDELRVTPRP